MVLVCDGAIGVEQAHDSLGGGVEASGAYGPLSSLELGAGGALFFFLVSRCALWRPNFFLPPAAESALAVAALLLLLTDHATNMPCNAGNNSTSANSGQEAQGRVRVLHRTPGG